MDRRQKKKERILTELFNSEQLQKIIPTIVYKAGLPMDAEIQQDILQETFYWLQRMELNKFLNAYNRNPKEIVALAVSTAARKGVYTDKKRNPNGKWWTHSIGQSIVHASTLNSKYHIVTTNPSDKANNNIDLEDSNFLDLEEKETYNTEMWQHVKDMLPSSDIRLLNVLLKHKHTKLIGNRKKQYKELLPKLEQIITQYQTFNQ